MRQLSMCAVPVTVVFLASGILAGPMVDPGSGAIKSDLMALAGAGDIDNITMMWPLPWASILWRLNTTDFTGQPAYIRDAARRVRQVAARDCGSQHPVAGFSLSATSDPAIVRGFDAAANEKGRGQVMAEARWRTSVLHFQIGVRSRSRDDKQIYDLDGTYAAQRLGPATLYAGWKTHWWGPGWMSALSLSNNARPMPQIGLTRSHTDAFKSPWLSWIGPWQAEMFGGLLNGKRTDKNTGFVAFRFGFNPLPGLEIGLARLTELCGSHHSCNPFSEYFSLETKKYGPNDSNDEGDIDIRYTGMIGRFGYSLYTQLMSEDTNPFWHSGSSHLFGASVWTGVPGGTGRFTAEYTDTVATHDIWGGGTRNLWSGQTNGFAYNHGGYVDGWRYRGRNLGFSLDSNSRLLSFQGQYVRDAGDSYTLSFHHAEINTYGLSGLGAFRNTVSGSPVIINTLEASGSYPFVADARQITLSLRARVADDQPRPDHGWTGAIEAGLSVGL